MTNYKIDNAKKIRKPTTKHTTVRVGMTFGRLTMVKNLGFINIGNSGKGSLWLCTCVCGEEKEVPQYALINGHTKSCGCFQKEARKLPEGQAGLNQLLRTYKNNAKKRGLDWRLTREQFKTLTKQSCFYCGGAPERVVKPNPKGNDLEGNYTYNGIDRLDNSKGYTKKNSVPCCYACNRKKGGLSLEVMIKVLNKLDYKVEKMDDFL